MKILVASNYFKGSLSSVDAACIVKEAILEVNPQFNVVTVPIADGGDGTIESIFHYKKYDKVFTRVTGPLGKKVKACWLYDKLNKTAIIEAKQANGFCLLPESELNPMEATTEGVGELIKSALDEHVETIVLTLGGSCTNDAGAGMLKALGVRFYDKSKKIIEPIAFNLSLVDFIDLELLDARILQTKIIVACDVNNPLCGKNGASFVYAPQKGASPEEVKILDKNLQHFADKTAQVKGIHFENAPGAGAAGGLGFALMSFFGAEFIAGFDLIKKYVNLEDEIINSDLVITTEGRLDSQSLSGKAPYKLACLAKKYNKPVIVFAGSVDSSVIDSESAFTAAFSIVDGPVSIDYSMKNAKELLYKKVKQLFSLVSVLNINKS